MKPGRDLFRHRTYLFANSLGIVSVPISDDDRSHITALLQRATAEDRDARDELYRVVWDELHQLARGIQRGRPSGDLQTTAVLNEVVLRFEKADLLKNLPNRKAFFSVAVRVINQVLIDHYRKRKKGIDSPDRANAALDSAIATIEESTGFDFELLHLELERLEATAPRQHAVVTHRFFGGLTIAETAELLGVADGTVERDWRLARAKLRRAMSQR